MGKKEQKEFGAMEALITVNEDEERSKYDAGISEEDAMEQRAYTIYLLEYLRDDVERFFPQAVPRADIRRLVASIVSAVSACLRADMAVSAAAEEGVDIEWTADRWDREGLERDEKDGPGWDDHDDMSDMVAVVEKVCELKKKP